MEGCTMMEEKSFDLDGILDELSSRLEDMVQDILVDQVEDAVTCAVQDVFDEALHSSLSRFEFVLNSGTIVRPKEQMKVLSPDKTKLLCCHGGLRVDLTARIVYIDGEEMATALGVFFENLYAVKPQAIGGALPDSNIYLVK